MYIYIYVYKCIYIWLRIPIYIYYIYVYTRHYGAKISFRVSHQGKLDSTSPSSKVLHTGVGSLLHNTLDSKAWKLGSFIQVVSHVRENTQDVSGRSSLANWRSHESQCPCWTGMFFGQATLENMSKEQVATKGSMDFSSKPTGKARTIPGTFTCYLCYQQTVINMLPIPKWSQENQPKRSQASTLRCVGWLAAASTCFNPNLQLLRLGGSWLPHFAGQLLKELHWCPSPAVEKDPRGTPKIAGCFTDEILGYSTVNLGTFTNQKCSGNGFGENYECLQGK